MFIFFEKLFHSCDKTKNALMRSMQFQEEYRQADHGRMHSEQFKLYDTEGEKITGEQIVDTNGSGHGALTGFLQAARVDALICGGIGMGARMALADVGIRETIEHCIDSGKPIALWQAIIKLAALLSKLMANGATWNCYLFPRRNIVRA